MSGIRDLLVVALLATCITTTITVSNGTTQRLHPHRYGVPKTNSLAQLTYALDPMLKSRTVKLLQNAVNFWRQNTCIRFIREADPLLANVRFVPDEEDISEAALNDTENRPTFDYGNKFQFGALTNNEIRLVYVPEDDLPQKYIRAIGHLLGLGFQHQRIDRDEYLNFYRNNIEKAKNWDFFEMSPNEQTNLPFDYGSMTMVDPKLYARPRTVVLEPKNPLYRETPNQLDPSFLDVYSVNSIHGCIDHTPNECVNHGYKVTNGNRCICPTGFGGQNCATQPCDDESTTIIADLQRNYYGSVKGGARKTIWVQARERGAGIQIILDEVKGNCVQGCIDGGLEVKFLSDKRLSGASFCCDYRMNGLLITSNESMVPVIAVNRGDRSSTIFYKFRYRQVTEKMIVENKIGRNEGRIRTSAVRKLDFEHSLPFKHARTPVQTFVNVQASAEVGEDENYGIMTIQVPDQDWRKHAAEALGLNGIEFNPISLDYPEQLIFRRRSNMMLSVPKSMVKVSSTGNCLFESLSYLIIGNTSAHAVIRRMIVEYVVKHKDEKWTKLDDTNTLDMDNYVKVMLNASRSSGDIQRWGTIVEIIACARLVDANIAVWVEDEHGWMIFTPTSTTFEDISKSTPIARPTLALWFRTCHYEPIVEIS